MSPAQLGIDGQVQPERVCACPCKRSLAGMRRDAIWYSRACAVAWRRNHPGESLYAARSTNVGRTKPRRTAAERGLQASYPKVLHAAMQMLRCANRERMATGEHRPVPELAREFMRRSLSDSQRARLEQRERAAA